MTKTGKYIFLHETDLDNFADSGDLKSHSSLSNERGSVFYLTLQRGVKVLVYGTRNPFSTRCFDETWNNLEQNSGKCFVVFL